MGGKNIKYEKLSFPLPPRGAISHYNGVASSNPSIYKNSLVKIENHKIYLNSLERFIEEEKIQFRSRAGLLSNVGINFISVTRNTSSVPRLFEF